MKFLEIGLDKNIQKSIEDLGFETPTPKFPSSSSNNFVSPPEITLNSLKLFALLN